MVHDLSSFTSLDFQSVARAEVCCRDRCYAYRTTQAIRLRAGGLQQPYGESNLGFPGGESLHDAILRRGHSSGNPASCILAALHSIYLTKWLTRKRGEQFSYEQDFKDFISVTGDRNS